MIVVSMPMVDGLPFIPAAALINKEGNSGWYTAYFVPVSEQWISLYEVPGSPGAFLAFPNDASLMRALPAGVPWDRKLWKIWRIEEAANPEFRGRVMELDTAPTRDATEAQPWTIDGEMVTRAEPVLRSRCGHISELILREETA